MNIIRIGGRGILKRLLTKFIIMKVYTDLELAELRSALDIDDDIQLQLTYRPVQTYCRYLNNLLAGRDGITVRLYSYEGAFKDLSFLKDIPNIKRLKLDDNCIADISFLRELESLEFLKLSKTKDQKMDLSVLFKLKRLTVLELDGQSNALPLIQNEGRFTELYLTSINLGNLAFLKNLEYLKNLDLSRCKCTNYEAIGHCDSLRYLCLERIGVESIDFIGWLHNLEFLRLESINITELPSFAECKRLKRIFLKGLSKLASYKQLATAASLEELSITNVATLNIDDFYFIEKSKSIKTVTADIKNNKTSKEFYEFIRAYTPDPGRV